ncbi:unnamed protein product (macronuclear) [Paramecium tetraurelia]|uniref:Uncharacterized protein n=1 Tax=Paramecium tetraurelia TaxID=5888 RepID=A0D737_PARTE|nr:uncharacterized protein GSPATT00001895001 [Paramecium tetraurelia]CAK78854.1 unnamed protein product [Paramecium tetraurelia]|eukprot:XP_001446251.1 hypothetical protein (macronuclear) [Paramecium tetraurelia strain d4-2]
MQNFHDFLNKLRNYQEIDIPCYYRNQFKTKESLINPNFYEISEKLLTQNYHKLNKKWDQQCKQSFILAMIKYFQMKNKKTINPTSEEWKELTSIFGQEEQTLKQRWITLITPMAKSLIWEKEEDDIIKSQMNVKQGKHIWTEIALELYNHNNGLYVRTPKQVRERWMNYLNPILKKSSWTDREDHQLLSLAIENGKRWSMISKYLDGRTENQVKNRYKSLLHRIYQEQDDDDIDELIAVKQYISKRPLRSPDHKSKQDSNLMETSKDKIQKTIPHKEEKQELKEDILIQSKKVKIDTEKLDQNAINQENQYIYLLQQVKNQFCYSTQGNCDTQSLGNRSSLSDFNYLGSFKVQEINNSCNEQNKISTQIFSDSFQNLEQPQLSLSNSKIKEQTNEQDSNNVYQSIGVGINVHQCCKDQFPNLFEFNQSASIVHTPLYFNNSQSIGKSPLLSPLQSPQLCIYQQELILEQDQSDNQFQFLNKSDLISKWKNKRKCELQNTND